MPKVTIFQDKSIDEEQLQKLLAEAGCPPTNVEADHEEHDEESTLVEGAAGVTDEPIKNEDGDECEPDVLVVVLTSEVCGSQNLEELLKNAINTRCRVVGVWPKGTEGGTTLPDVFRKYGASEVIWDREQVRDVICGGKTLHQSLEGDLRPSVETERNCC